MIKYNSSIPNALMEYTCNVSNTLQVWFLKELDAIEYFEQTPVEKRAMMEPLRISKIDPTWRVNTYL